MPKKPISPLISLCSLILILSGAAVLTSEPAQAATTDPNCTQQLGPWQQMAPAPAIHHEGAAVVVGGKLFLFTGFVANNLTVSNRVDVYNPATNIWETVAVPRSPVPVAMSHAQGAADGNIVWLAGGFLGRHPGEATSQVWRYDTVYDVWSAGPPLPAPRASGALVVSGRNLHYIGGMQPDRVTTASDHWVLNLDSPNATWVSAAPIPRPRNHFQAVAMDGLIYLAGGAIGHDVSPVDTNYLDIYNPASNTWQTGANLPAPRSHAEPGTFILNGRIIVTGGRNNTASGPNGTNLIFEYNSQTNSWSTLGTLPTNLFAPSANVIGNRFIITTGGYSYNNFHTNTWVSTLTSNCTALPPPATPTPAPTGSPAACSGLTQEAETGLRFGHFALGSHSAASGGQYVHVPNGTGDFWELDMDSRVTYCFNVTTAGTYRIKAWVYGPSNDDSFYVWFNNSLGVWDTLPNTSYAADYVNHRNVADPMNYSLSAGQHYLVIYPREDGARLDKFQLELVSASTATPTATATSTATSTATASPTPSTQVVYRINAAGPQVTTGGVTWSANQYASGGQNGSYVTSISSTTDDVLFHTYRVASSDSGSFSYNLPLSAGTYTVRLLFAEPYFTGQAGRGPAGTGRRVFNVQIEGATVLSSYDINASVGPLTADIKTFQNITVSDGTLNINFPPAIVNRPLVSAIEVIRINTQATPTPTSTPTPTGSPGNCGLIQEAEAGTRYGSFVIGNDANASGGQYVHVPNGAGDAWSFGSPSRVIYCFDVTQAGTYRVRGWVWGTGGDNSDSFYVDFNGSVSTWDTLPNTSYQPDYVSHRGGADPVEYTLTPGQHQLAVYLREDGTRLDKIELELVGATTSTGSVLYRINTGGPAVTTGGVTWSADQYYNDGQANLFVSEINNTADDVLYHTERSSSSAAGSFSYSLPVSPGTYTVRLHFAEIYFTGQPGRGPSGSGRRVFNVSIEGVQVLTNYDINAAVGPLTADLRLFENISVGDGALTIQFLPGIADRPTIEAIEVYAAGSGASSAQAVSAAAEPMPTQTPAPDSPPDMPVLSPALTEIAPSNPGAPTPAAPTPAASAPSAAPTQAPTPVPVAAVTGFTLVNADTGEDIAPLHDGAILKLSDLPGVNLNVRADVTGVVGSVVFMVNSAHFRTENGAPYMLAGDAAGRYFIWTLAPGTYVITATPYTGSNGQNEAGSGLTVMFEVVE